MASDDSLVNVTNIPALWKMHKELHDVVYVVIDDKNPNGDLLSLEQHPTEPPVGTSTEITTLTSNVPHGIETLFDVTLYFSAPITGAKLRLEVYKQHYPGVTFELVQTSPTTYKALGLDKEHQANVIGFFCFPLTFKLDIPTEANKEFIQGLASGASTANLGMTIGYYVPELRTLLINLGPRANGKVPKLLIHPKELPKVFHCERLVDAKGPDAIGAMITKQLDYAYLTCTKDASNDLLLDLQPDDQEVVPPGTFQMTKSVPMYSNTIFDVNLYLSAPVNEPKLKMVVYGDRVPGISFELVQTSATSYKALGLDVTHQANITGYCYSPFTFKLEMPTESNTEFIQGLSTGTSTAALGMTWGYYKKDFAEKLAEGCNSTENPPRLLINPGVL